jgi:uncharacterized FlaG/YvyC family protein
MRIEDSNPLPAPAPESRVRAQEQKAEDARAAQAASAGRDELTTHALSSNPLNVVVEMESNRLVYKFVDEGTGEVVQQIPCAAMLRMAEAISSLLQALNDKQTATK